MMCTDTVGASKLLGVSRMTLYLWRKSGLIESFQSDWKTFVPIRAIAKTLRRTQREIIDLADKKRIPIWRVSP